MHRLLLILLLITSVATPQSFRGDPVDPVTFFDGTVEGLGTNGDEHYLLVHGRRWHLANNSFYREIDYGDWVRLACLPDVCWVIAWEDKSEKP